MVGFGFRLTSTLIYDIHWIEFPNRQTVFSPTDSYGDVLAWSALFSQHLVSKYRIIWIVVFVLYLQTMVESHMKIIRRNLYHMI